MTLLQQLLFPEKNTVVSVYELTTQIRQILEDKFGFVAIQGEISNFKKHSSGHWYFTLKDDKAQIRAACFRNANMRIKFLPTDGLSVCAYGKISVYEPRGDYQLLIENIEPVGIGSLQLAFEQLKAKLEQEGLFDRSRKKTIPMLPRRVGIVTSQNGAAIRDILRVLSRRNDSVSVLLYPAAVEGDGAAIQIANGVKYFNDHINDLNAVDVIIVGRGGGSIESLWAFNEEVVAREIFNSQIPVISAVGHEVDFTIADFVADMRAPTPSAAAELVAVRKDELLAGLLGIEGKLEQLLKYCLLNLRVKLNTFSQNKVFTEVSSKLRDHEQHLDELTTILEDSISGQLRVFVERENRATQQLKTYDWMHRLEVRKQILSQVEVNLRQIMNSNLERTVHRLNKNISQLDTLSPLQVLKRGYAIVLDSNNNLIKRSADVLIGDKLTVKVSEGEFMCNVVTQVKN